MEGDSTDCAVTFHNSFRLLYIFRSFSCLVFTFFTIMFRRLLYHEMFTQNRTRLPLYLFQNSKIPIKRLRVNTYGRQYPITRSRCLSDSADAQWVWFIREYFNNISDCVPRRYFCADEDI